MSDGQAYENFFIQIMQYAYENFKPVKPQGSYGDRKNDGFDKSTGTYYQVYAPENISTKINDAINKLISDFKGLYDYWDKISKIKRYFFAINDKYKGTFPTLEEELSKIEKKYPEIQCNSFLNKDLERVFMSLSREQISSIVGITPDPLNISDIDFGSMNEVINHLMRMHFSYSEEKIPQDPDFNEKIVFNNLSESIARLLHQGNYQNHVIKEFFEKNRSGLKGELKELFVKFYSEGVREVNGESNKNDIVFFYILEKVSPKNTKPVQDAALVLMAYYFEYCDIFQTPPSRENK